MPSFDEITRRWKERVEGSRELEIAEVDEEESLGPFASRIYGWEYERAQALLRSLLRTYRNKTLSQALPGEIVSTSHGSCFHLHAERQGPFFNFDAEKTRELLISDVKLLYGIGDVTEEMLKRQGVSSIEDLGDHPLWATSAKEFLHLIESGDLLTLQEWLWRWLPKSHPKAFSLAGLCDVRDFLIFDIETLGLFGRPIVLLGLAQLQGETMSVHQYLLRDLSDEPAALTAFCQHITARTALITFNGRSFDLPYLQERLGYYGLERVPDLVHFDMLHFARRQWRSHFQDCTLTTLERELFGHIRRDDVPSALVPDFYDAYLNRKNVGPLIPIVQHNQQDILTLATLFSDLSQRWEHGNW
jgi:uncharacterized protein YprB with RNaseH-like and TPR domain